VDRNYPPFFHILTEREDMARLKDTTSLRQRIFVSLDGMSSLNRSESVAGIMEKFDVKESYVRSLYQEHRKTRSTDTSNNNFITIYKVNDHKGNYRVEPFMSETIKQNPDVHESRTKQKAIQAYKQLNLNKNKLASKLK
jgi:hypothetical protein